MRFHFPFQPSSLYLTRPKWCRANNFSTLPTCGPDTRITDKAERPGDVANAKIVSAKENGFIKWFKVFTMLTLIIRTLLNPQCQTIKHHVQKLLFIAPWLYSCLLKWNWPVYLIGNNTPLQNLSKNCFSRETIRQIKHYLNGQLSNFTVPLDYRLTAPLL